MRMNTVQSPVSSRNAPRRIRMSPRITIPLGCLAASLSAAVLAGTTFTPPPGPMATPAQIAAVLATIPPSADSETVVDFEKAEIGAPVRFTVATMPDRTFDGRVVRVAPAIDSLTRTLEVFASVEDPGRVLRPEMFATAQILGRAMEPVAQVPSAAVQAIEGDTVLIVADKRGEGLRLEAVRVRIGRRTPELAEVLAGADTGMAVVVKGAAIARAELLRRRGSLGGEH